MDLDIQSYSLGHLGIVAGIFDALKIGEVIDGLCEQGSKNLPHSTIIKAMILMAWVSLISALSIPNYFMTIPTEKLLGEASVPLISMTMLLAGLLTRFIDMVQLSCSIKSLCM